MNSNTNDRPPKQEEKKWYQNYQTWLIISGLILLIVGIIAAFTVIFRHQYIKSESFRPGLYFRDMKTDEFRRLDRNSRDEKALFKIFEVFENVTEGTEPVYKRGVENYTGELEYMHVPEDYFDNFKVTKYYVSLDQSTNVIDPTSNVVNDTTSE